MTHADLVDQLRILAKHPLAIVGIDGGGGSGKSTLAKRLGEELSGVQVIHMDDFYRRKAELVVSDGDQNVNFHWQALQTQVLKPLRNGRAGKFHPLFWQEDRYADAPVTIAANGLVIVEGVMSLRRELRPYYDLTVWLECPHETRLARGLQRDGESSRDLWISRWLPAEERYKAAHRPHEAADFILITG